MYDMCAKKTLNNRYKYVIRCFHFLAVFADQIYFWKFKRVF